MYNDPKSSRIKLQSEIISLIYKDNKNTVHFDYHVDIDAGEDSIRLDLYTHNERHDEIFLLHQTKGHSSLETLHKMVAYLKTRFHGNDNKHSYTVTWTHTNDPSSTEHQSYFFEYSEEDVRQKFFYGKKREDFTILNIIENPMA